MKSKILFSASIIGEIAQGILTQGITEKQYLELQSLIERSEEIIGLTEKQQQDLDKWNQKVSEGKTITQTQKEKREDYISRLTKKRGLTPTQKARVEELKEIASRPPELTKGAKTRIKKIWLFNEKGFKEDIQTKHTRKGNQSEEDGILLISKVDNIQYHNNNSKKDGGRITKGNLTGACDIIHNGVIHDIKCSWNPLTFMQSDLTSIYEWQLRAYMYLYNASKAKLRYCLVDCPPEVYIDEYNKYKWIHNIIDDEHPDYKDLIEQFNANYLYADSGKYTEEERVKTYEIERDEKFEDVILQSIDLAIEYYKTIKLNQKD